MPAELQVKLLRTLESNTIVRVGGHESIPLDVRIVAATHHDPVEAVRSGRLREDLFYRIATVACTCPRSGSARTTSTISRCRSSSG